jgi:hypothetical protein
MSDILEAYLRYMSVQEMAVLPFQVVKVKTIPVTGHADP